VSTARIIVVDDDPIGLKLVSQVLVGQGHFVRPTSKAGQALQSVTDDAPIDVVVSDSRMTVGQEDLLGEVHRISPQTATVLMTGGIIKPAENDGTVRVLQKPVDPEDLIAAVRDCLNRSARLREESQLDRERSSQLRSDTRVLRGEVHNLRRELEETLQRFRPEKFRLKTTTVAIGSKNGKRVAMYVPAGAEIVVFGRIWEMSDPAHNRQVEVLWEGQTVTMFAVDILWRADRVPDGPGHDTRQ
jgi:CheY-like chemotaxis protein